MCKEEFSELPTWKQTNVKKQVGLFWSTPALQRQSVFTSANQCIFYSVSLFLTQATETLISSLFYIFRTPSLWGVAVLFVISESVILHFASTQDGRPNTRPRLNRMQPQASLLFCQLPWSKYLFVSCSLSFLIFACMRRLREEVYLK